MAFRLRYSVFGLILGIGAVFSEFSVAADAPYTLKNYDAPKRMTKDEPLAQTFSMERSLRALDRASLQWQVKHKCFTCHTNHPYLYIRPLISAEDPAPREIRQALENNVSRSLTNKSRGRRYGLYDYDVTADATTLAINDSITTKKLHPLTKQALDLMWSFQKPDGAVAWWVGSTPVGSQQFGELITSIAVAVAPEGYSKTEAAQKGLARIRCWLENNPPRNLHEKAMLLWASSYYDDYLKPEDKATFVKKLCAEQLKDGSWTESALWDPVQRTQGEDGEGPPTGDGYATALAVYAMRKAGVSIQDPAIKRGIAWLKSNQRESGRWFTRSRINLTDVGTAFAVMALQACGESSPSNQPSKK